MFLIDGGDFPPSEETLGGSLTRVTGALSSSTQVLFFFFPDNSLIHKNNTSSFTF